MTLADRIKAKLKEDLEIEKQRAVTKDWYFFQSIRVEALYRAVDYIESGCAHAVPVIPACGFCSKLAEIANLFGVVSPIPGEHYREFVARTNRLPTFEHAVLGLVAEAGEVADIYKKHLYKNIALDKQAMLDELGDVRWYVEALLILLDENMESLELRNQEKLLLRSEGNK